MYGRGGAIGLFAIAKANGLALRVPRGEWPRPMESALFNITGWNLLIAFGLKYVAAIGICVAHIYKDELCTDLSAIIHAAFRASIARNQAACSLWRDRQIRFKKYPKLEPDDIHQALEFAACRLM